MKPRFPALLLAFYVFFLQKDVLMTQVVIYHIQSMQITRQAKRKLTLELASDDDLNESLKDFLMAAWLNPGSVEANAYLGLLAPYLSTYP